MVIVNTTQEHIDYMKPRLRQVDEDQCWALAHITAAFGMQYSFDRARFSFTALIEGAPVACWGVSSNTVFSREGTPWFAGIGDLNSFSRKIVRHSKKTVAYMLSYFERLESWVDTRNKVSLNWLKWCGFNIEDAIQLGPDNKDFHKVWMERGGK